jgi:hypothetical protein
VRNISGAFRNGDSAAPAAPPAAPADSPAAPAAPGPAAAANPFAWSGDDPVSRAVRAGCDVVEKAVRRGFGLGRDPSASPAGLPWLPWAGGPLSGSPTGSFSGASAGPWMGGWTTGQWVDTMTTAFTQWTQWIDAWSAMARSSLPGGGEAPASWAPAPSRPGAPGAAPSPAPSAAPAALRLTVELRSPRAVTVELDLPSGAAPGTALEVHGLLAPPAAAAPPITDVSLVVTDGGVSVALGSLDQHPAGSYAGAVLAAGRACGTLTVRLV